MTDGSSEACTPAAWSHAAPTAAGADTCSMATAERVAKGNTAHARPRGQCEGLRGSLEGREVHMARSWRATVGTQRRRGLMQRGTVYPRRICRA
jgi:hypothetical protein